MHEAFSFNREYDYIRLEGLSRATGRPAHEWDLYILKELIDNALDADESLWQDDPQQHPALHIHMEYISVPPPQKQQLLVRVRNRAMFPVERIQNIFATQRYTSRKAFMKGLERGALGNALKTLLGIPYALHNRVADNWKPDLKPLSICCDKTEYLPRYIIEPTAQSIRLEIDRKPCKPVEGTVITIGLDYFVQEIPRTLSEIQLVAQQYHVCNPHAEFTWSVEIENQVWKEVYSKNADWTNKFRGIAPMQWYSLTDFKNLLGALYREYCTTSERQRLAVQTVCKYFPGFNGQALQNEISLGTILREIEQDSFTAMDIESARAKALYIALSKQSPPFHSLHLGCIGQEHIDDVLKRYLPVEGKIHYAIATETDNDPSLPFVIEAAVAYLKKGKRQIWTAINFSPTYNDPFLSRWLSIPTQPSELVLGLRNLLDTYAFREDTPVVLFLHLICPTIEHNEFSKTEINHLPFKKELGNMLDKLLTASRQRHEEDEMHLEQVIFQTLNTILNKTSINEQFSVEQLLEQLRQELSLDQTFAFWLERPDTVERLRAYLTSYQSYKPDMNRFVARQGDVVLHVPSHPKHYFSIPIEHISRDVLNHYYVNKIVYVRAKELEPVIIANNWLCRMDMALLHSPLDFTVFEAALLQCLHQCDLPILILHNANKEGYELVQQIHTRLNQHQANVQRIVDVNPLQESPSSSTIQPTKLRPRDLEIWLLERFEMLGIPVKHTPTLTDIRKDIRGRFEQLLQGYLFERIKQRFALTALMIDFDNALSYTRMMMDEALDEQLNHHLKQQAATDSYSSVLDSITGEFFERFMNKNGLKVQHMEQVWFAQRQDESMQ